MTTKCDKRPYKSERSAHAKLKKVRRGRLRTHAARMETCVYQCEVCRAWHLTSSEHERK